MSALYRLRFVAAVIVVALSALFYVPFLLGALTSADDTLLRWVTSTRGEWLTRIAKAMEALGSSWTVRVTAWLTIGILVVFRRFRHLAVYLASFLGCSVAGSLMAASVGRMRPAVGTVLGGWEGYSYPSRPVAMFTLVLFGALYTLVPAGRWRRLGDWLAMGLVVAVGLARLYLAIDHPSDLAAGLALGWVVPSAAFLIAAPEEAFPVSYSNGNRAHLDIGGRRGAAIASAFEEQLGLRVTSVQPCALEGSSGSMPLLVRVDRAGQGGGGMVFAKLYALNHLRSDRWYKLARTVLYGRLEDERPFSTVRRLVEYEDHMLRLLRDEGLPTPKPYGIVEITPEREYVLVMEYFEGAKEIGASGLDDATIADGLGVVRRLWDAGVAHRDIKPSNLMVREGRVLLVDVAFAALRPTPWRQAVDLANMILTLSLHSNPERVYRQTLAYFTPVEIAEAMAASRSVTVPSELRARLREDGRDLYGGFLKLVPASSPVVVQLWDVRRFALTLGVLAGVALAVGAGAAYLETTGLL